MQPCHRTAHALVALPEQRIAAPLWKRGVFVRGRWQPSRPTVLGMGIRAWHVRAVPVVADVIVRVLVPLTRFVGRRRGWRASPSGVAVCFPPFVSSFLGFFLATSRPPGRPAFVDAFSHRIGRPRSLTCVLSCVRALDGRLRRCVRVCFAAWAVSLEGRPMTELPPRLRSLTTVCPLATPVCCRRRAVARQRYYCVASTAARVVPCTLRRASDCVFMQCFLASLLGRGGGWQAWSVLSSFLIHAGLFWLVRLLTGRVCLAAGACRAEG